MKKNIKLLLFICVALLTFCINIKNVEAAIKYEGSFPNNAWPLNSYKTVYAYVWNKVLYIKGNSDFSDERFCTLFYNDLVIEPDTDFFYLDIGEGITEVPCIGPNISFSGFEIRAIHIPKSLKSIPALTFIDVASLQTDDSNYGIFYDGTEEEWEEVNKGIGNDSLENARISFNGSKKISDLEYDIYEKSKKSDDLELIDEEPDLPYYHSLPRKELPVIINDIIHNGDVLDFGMTNFSGAINYYVTNDENSTKLGSQKEIGLDTKLTVKSSSIDPNATGWKVFKINYSELYVYPVEFIKTIKYSDDASVVKIGDIINNGKVLDLTDNVAKKGKVIYTAPKGETLDNITIEGKTVELKSVFEIKSKVLSWKVISIDHTNAIVTLEPYMFENNFKIDNKVIEKNNLILSRDTLKFPYKDVETTINFYENGNSSTPLKTIKVTNSYKLDAPDVYGETVINAWTVKDIDYYNSIISLYPNQNNINREFKLISNNHNYELDFNDLYDANLRFTSDVKIKGATTIMLDKYADGNRIEVKYEDLKEINENGIWVIDDMDRQSDSLTVYLLPETTTNPQYIDFYSKYKEGTKFNPWFVGETENDDVFAYFEGYHLIFVGNGRMRDFHYNQPWYSESDEITSATIGEGIKNVGAYAFSVTDIKSASLPSTVTEIGDNAFANCIWFSSINIPHSLVKIGSDAFYDDFNLRSINLNKELKEIGKDAFSGTNARDVTYEGDENEFNKIKIGEGNDCLYIGTRTYLDVEHVNFALYGYAEEMEQVEIESGNILTKPSDPIPTIDGIFEGWYEDPNFTTKFDFSKPITKDTTIYAHFRKYIHEINIEVPAIIDGVKAPKKFNVSTDLEGMFNGLTKSAYDVEITKENDRPLSYWQLLGKFETGETYLIKNLAIIPDNNHFFADDLVINCNQETMTIKGISKGSANLSFRFVAKNKVATTETEFYEVGDGENALYLEDEKEHTYGLTIIDYNNYNETELENNNLSKEHQTKSKNAVSDYTNLSLLSLYDIKLVDDEGNKVEDGPIGIKIKLDSNKKNYKNFKLLYINEDYMIEEEPITLKVEDNYLVGTLPHLSNYALVAEKNETNPKTGDNLILWISMLALSTIAISYTVYKLKKD